METNGHRSPGNRRRALGRGALAGITVIAVMAGLAACNGTGTAGTGPTISETREAGAYTRVEAGFGVDLDIRIGSSPSIEVEAAENLVPLVATRIKGDTLEIHPTTEIAGPLPRVHLVVVDLDHISLSGGARATIDGLAADSLGAEVSGGSVLSGNGSVDHLEIEAGGGAVASLRDLAVTTAVVDIGGGAKAELQASDTVVGGVSGGSSLTVAGDARVNVDSSGGGSVARG